MKVDHMNTIQRGSFKQKPLAAAVLLALATPFIAELAYANGGGYGPNTDVSGRTIDVQTYYASSPQGVRPAYDFTTHTLSAPVLDTLGNVVTPAVTINTGTPIRKFVDPLGGAYRGVGSVAGAADLGTGLPVAITEKWLNPLTGVQTTDDYLEIAIVEFAQQLHSDLPKATTMRGYVQIETDAIRANNMKDAAGIPSEHITATYPDGTPIKDASGAQVYFVHKPHDLGPVILASKGTPVRMKYTNYLPYTDWNGAAVGAPHGGKMVIPVDRTISGSGPLLKADGTVDLLREFSENRASIHWHGGDTPWISDGTPHQWIAPAGDISWKPGMDGSTIGNGVSFRNVPDMPDPGPGSGTMYYPNNMSGRLMFYHDHTSGLTRLNVYLGEAAGYVILDPVEQALVAKHIGAAGATGALDTIGIPLVLQDRTFVPNNIGPVGGTVKVGAATELVTQSQDAKWALNHWGQPGDLWYPHVYETNQDPNSWDGTNPTGRWDWGPWFWPVFPSQFSLPTGEYGDVTLTPEAFMDTPTVNGQAYPTMTVEPKTYRFRILNAANDRTQNLNFFMAVDATNAICDAAAVPAPATSMDGKPLATCTEVRMVPATPTAGFPAKWPTDGRAGGVPDPTTAGPDIVQIGSEGGLLPAPAILKSQPVTYDLDKRSITILNILDHGVLLGGAERADVLVDFSKYAGKTLILYNDAPTPMPAVDPRTDYYTGMGDNTDAGGAYDVLAGYGPNTRTIMQFKVAAATANGVAAPALDTVQLAKDLTVAYATSQPAPLVPQKVYNAPFGTASADNYAQIFTGGMTQPYFLMQGDTFKVTGATVVNGGSGYDSLIPPAVTFTAPPAGGVAATATAVVTNGVVTGFANFLPGSGYDNTVPLKVTIAPPPVGVGGTRATAKVEVNAFKVINKAIQELFDPVYGRMNATLAVEIPFTSQAVATTIPLAYIDTPVESLDAIKDGETQIWKITHNGVDSHPVHFHLMNVQLINRVDWAGVIKPPKPSEMGWKETITMNPLEDVYVAARPERPAVPFGLPTSRRMLDPSQAADSTVAFTNLDPVTGQAPTFQRQLVNGVNVDVPTAGAYSNKLTDFDNEYVWHCHILGHEENDFMRPMIFHPDVVRPDAPGTVVTTTNAGVSTVTWKDPTPFGGVDAAGVLTAFPGSTTVNAGTIVKVPASNNAKNEIGFKVLRTVTKTETATDSTVAAAPVVTQVVTQLPPVVAMVPANVESWTDGMSLPITADVVNGTVTTVTTYAASYQVVAYNAAGDSIVGSPAANAPPAPPVTQTGPVVAAPGATAAPTGLTQSYTGGVTTLSWNPVAGATGYTVTGATCTPVTATSCTITGYASANIAVTALVGGVPSDAATAYNGLAYSPVALTNSNGATGAMQPGSFTLTWANDPRNLNNVTGIQLTWSLKGSATVLTQTFAPTSTGATVIGLSRDKDYNITLTAIGAIGNSTPVTRRVLSAP